MVHMFPVFSSVVLQGSVAGSISYCCLLWMVPLVEYMLIRHCITSILNDYTSTEEHWLLTFLDYQKLSALNSQKCYCIILTRKLSAKLWIPRKWPTCKCMLFNIITEKFHSAHSLSGTLLPPVASINWQWATQCFDLLLSSLRTQDSRLKTWSNLSLDTVAISTLIV